MNNKEKFLALVSNEKTDTLAKIKERVKNIAMLRESQTIALKVLLKLDELGWSQKTLAEKMEVSPQQISKIVSGKENLTIDTQVKLQKLLDIPILASYYENNTSQYVATTTISSKRLGYKHHQPIQKESEPAIINNITSSLRVSYNSFNPEQKEVA
ncbi:MAG TPA: XRE family transcriptional regulator [Bacteroidales bacterium]|nr:MAG: hypothetical protein A2W98_10870 [Bacteroidetes bacterium GWF2_33_38]OFY73918.1 MAG: hypothetical protein A2265_08475 [Bacteroidetes bacterium RIFOXYA12_FULL_33_9]OFY89294.1 MAG: hypothetical protein A2236_14190 [Bacteroidetes bacterium RIFOXYA2_FULL_33_7]HBF88042.1 XRE family transcriptional regulator [Bacteroidales bacterium]